jgi:transcriptional regulator with XRE-family HTH domain
MEFFERVKALAKTNKLTIEYVVRQAGLTLGSYNSYRRNKNLPRADEAQMIAQALGTTVEFLLTGAETENSTSNLINDLQKLIEKHSKK